MRGAWLLIPLILFFAGCKSFGDKRNGALASESKDKSQPDDPKKQKHWLDDPSPDWAKGDVPKANSWADPRDKKFDYTNYVKGALAGYVLDRSERPVGNAIIAVELADSNKKSQPMIVLADQSGAFAVHGLKPNETYILTAKMKDSGTVLAGQTYATPPSVNVRIRLSDSINMPNTPGFGKIDSSTPIASKTLPGSDLPPLPGPASIERDQSIRSPGSSFTDDAWSPTRSGSTPSLPTPSIPSSSTPNTPDIGSDRLHMPSPVSPSPATSRPDLNTSKPPENWKPPQAEIRPPGTGGATITPPPLTERSPIERQSGERPATENMVVRKSFVNLLDSTGRSVEMPTGYTGELILLDFLTSTCLPCKASAPQMIEFQRRYGSHGISIVGVLCDDKPEAERLRLAGQYVKQNNLNYLVYTEAKAREVQQKLNIQKYPTLVLLDPSGKVQWSGHPNNLAELEQIVQNLIKR